MKIILKSENTDNLIRISMFTYEHITFENHEYFIGKLEILSNICSKMKKSPKIFDFSVQTKLHMEEYEI